MQKPNTRKTALFAFTAAALLGIYTEATGCSHFDDSSGNNVLCDIDPTCRKLTDGEISLAQKVFGDQINYKRVKIFDRPFFLDPFRPYIAKTPNGNIYVKDKESRSKDFSTEYRKASLFIHEMTHVWQYQSGKMMLFSALYSYFKHNGHYSNSYDYTDADHNDFANWEIEQQARFLEHMIRDILRYDDIVERKDQYPYSVRGYEITFDMALKDTCSNLTQAKKVISNSIDFKLPKECVAFNIRQKHSPAVKTYRFTL